MSDANCETCMHAAEIEVGHRVKSKILECRRFPPSVFPDPYVYGRQMIEKFPRVLKNWRCGEFKGMR